VMLVDFGLVKFLDPHNPRTATIVRGLGTPEYTPLEQYDASMGHTDARSDIYALGATLYHLLTGHPPRPVSQRILKPDTHPDIRELNPKISAWMSVFVRKAMAVRPENRYQSAGEMRRDLRTQVFKVRRHSAVGPAPLRAPQTVRRQYRHGARKSAGRSSRRGRTRSSARWLPVLLPIAVPVGVVLFLTVTVTLISLATSSIVTAAVVASPLIFLGLAYYALVSGRRSGPPRI
jgi:serine/threonine protein kinase